MWIVRLALKRPYTFVVMALLLMIMGPLTILRTPTDIFPNINIPVVSVIWNYTGLPAQEMADRIVGSFERPATVTVNNIEHIESQVLNGVGVSKFFFHNGVNMDLSMSQMTAVAQTWLRYLPPGLTPPLILSYNASSVPVIQLVLSSKTISEQGLYDIANTFVRVQLATVQGASVPFPYGGKQRQVQVDLDQRALQAYGLSAQDVQNAVLAQNLIIPAGTQKIGQFEYNVRLNGSPVAIDELNDAPIRTVNGAIIHIRDVAHVRDGAPPQTNMVRMNGGHAVLMTVQKTSNASTLDIIEAIKAKLPAIRAAAPPDLDIQLVGDQSLFVKSAIDGVVREGLVAAALTGLMILLFLGSWRSTLIITISIPLSILASIICLSALGQTINIMTLGGLALAVGILVDDATVAIENINAHLEKGEAVEDAILNGAHEIATPALVATLCICIVFVPMFFLEGVSKYLFVPLAEAIVFAMLASYILSRTLVPTLAKALLHAHAPGHPAPANNPFGRLQAGFEHRFDRLREGYRGLLTAAIGRRALFIPVFLVCVFASMLLAPWLGSNFFPSVDGGQIKLHVRGHAGLRVEETARLCDQIEAEIRRTIPGAELDTLVDNIGLPYSGINLSYSNSAPIGASDADILVSLNKTHHPTADYVRTLRAKLPGQFPGVSFAFLPADIVTQILNFGSPAPIDVQIVGGNVAANNAVANALLAKMQKVPGIADARIQQALDAPEFDIDVDRVRSQDVGLTQRDVANNLLISLSGSQQTTPTFWLDTKSGNSYAIATQTPQGQLENLDALRNLPITGAPGVHPQILGALGTIKRAVGPAVVTHYNVQPAIDIFASNGDRDLGGVAADVRKLVAEARKTLPKGSSIVVRGQVQTMAASFDGLFFGLAFAILLVYLLIVVNFQSWLDPFIIITALPAALAGIVWMLFLTHTTLSVPALTGAIMSVGVATANSILVVSFARDRLAVGDCDAVTAAIEAGFGRFRPVLMTALAMIIGMLPMALGLGEGGEQNAPLGRAVIGGLAMATVATLVFVPAVFALLHERRAAAASARPRPAPPTLDGRPIHV
jgi:CzcA family heavy metal efflux pump